MPANQPTSLTATATDTAGNVSACSNPFAYTEDSIAPAVPAITDTDPDSPSVDITPQVKGTADPGSTVRIYTSANCSGTPAIGSAASFASHGDHRNRSGESDDQPDRDRDRHRGQRLGLLEPIPLHPGLDRSERAIGYGDRSRISLERQPA